MKSRSYKNGKATCKATLKKTGKSYEVGLTYGGTPLFLGNFILSSEATRFYAEMNKEIKKLSKKYKVGPSFPKSWFKNLISSHIFKKYYTFVNKQITNTQKKLKSNYSVWLISTAVTSSTIA